MITIELEQNQTYTTNLKEIFFGVGRKSIRDIAAIVKSDNEVNIAFGRSVFGGNVRPNKAGTRVLFKSGALFRSVKSAKVGTNYWVFLGNDRASIGARLQHGTSQMAPFTFWGLSKLTMDKVVEYVKNFKIDKNIAA